MNDVLDPFLRQKQSEANEAQGFRDLAMTGYGIRPEVQGFIRSHSDFSVEVLPGYGGGWMPPDSLEGKGKVVLASYQCEACIHENAHVWWHWERIHNPALRRTLVFQVSMYGELEPDTAPLLGIERETLEFIRGYYRGIGDWRGMYQDDPNRPRVTFRDLMDPNADISNVNDWETFAGLCSYPMGQLSTGPRRLPYGMRHLFAGFFTDNVLATPYYQGGPP